MSQFKSRWTMIFGSLFLLFFALFFWHVLRKQINANYIDFGDGSYLYESWRLSQGKLLYGQFLIPHPPVLFMWGAALMKISTSVIFIRSVNLVIYILGAALLYRVSRIVFRNTIASLFMTFFYFFLPFSIIWWSTFTTETLMRFLVLLLVNLLLPFDSLTRPKAVTAGLCMTALAFLKYSSAPILLFVGIYLLLFRKKNMLLTLCVCIASGLTVLVLLQAGTNGAFLHDTIAIRKYIPTKDVKSWAIMATVVLRFYAGFGLVNLILARRYRKKRNMDAVFLLLLPFLYFANVYITYFEGTFNYIYYPIEPFMAVGASLLASSLFTKGSSSRINRPTVSLIVPILLCVLTCVYLLQTSTLRIDFSMDDVERAVTQDALKLITSKTTDKDEILSPPYFAFLARRRITADVSDSFLWMMSYLYNKEDRVMVDKTLDSVVRKLSRREIKIVILDYHLKMITPFRKAVEANYVPVKDLKFVWNEVGESTVYLPRADAAQ